MKRISPKRILYAAIVSFAATALLADIAISGQNYTGSILQLQPRNSSVDCVWATLVGVAQADPILPNNLWFGRPRTQIGYSEIYAALLVAKMAGSTLTVMTTGAAAGGGCGSYPGISYVMR